jgi:hypothetical protein
MIAPHLRAIKLPTMRIAKHLLLSVAVHLALTTLATTPPALVAGKALEATPVRGTNAPGTKARLLRQEGQLQVEYRVGGEGPTTVTVSDAQGRVVMQERIDDRNTHVRAIPVGDRAGTYTIRFEQDGITQLKRLVIEQA